MGRIDLPDPRRDEDAYPKPWNCGCGRKIGGTHRRCPSCGGRPLNGGSAQVHDAHAASLYGGR